MARYPEVNPISPVIPTSYGLSYSTNSLPRNACTTGACSAPASAISCDVRPGTPGPGQDRHRAGRVQRRSRVHERGIAGPDHRRRRPDRHRLPGPSRVVQERPARHHDHRHAAAGQRRAHRDLQDPRQLLMGADQLAVHAALAEQLLRMGLLEVLPADLLGRDVRGDGQHRDPAAVGVEQAVDQVQVARSAAGRAHRQLPGQRRLRGRRERGRLLVPDVLPGDRAVPAHRVGEPVQRVPRDPVHPPHPRRPQRRYHHISHRGRHLLLLPVAPTNTTIPPRNGPPHAWETLDRFPG